MKVYDVSDPEWHPSTALADWLRAQGVDPKLCYRCEVDGSEMTVYEYALNDQGRIYRDGNEVAKRPPYRVTVSSPPPDVSSSVA